MRILGREPAALLGLVAIVVKLVTAFGASWSIDVQSGINAVAAAAVGLYVAWKVGDGLIAAITGLAQAAIALAVGVGLQWSPEQQAVVMAFVQLAASWFIRTQVTAPMPAGVVTPKPSSPTGV
jgi:hypothetical protein